MPTRNSRRKSKRELWKDGSRLRLCCCFTGDSSGYGSAEPGHGRFSVDIKKRKFIPTLFAAVPAAVVTTTVAAGVAVAAAITSPLILVGAAIKDKMDEHRGPRF
ncbi:hypothetical protein [Legionella sainthelensi]|uniref:hypothetical protein n=1 Tax=Legionella sainthelensi TaxID=28087 RepID=UPI000B1CEA6B|nr:hypothetical protein [Legionella sainthelensi]